MPFLALLSRSILQMGCIKIVPEALKTQDEEAGAHGKGSHPPTAGGHVCRARSRFQVEPLQATWRSLGFICTACYRSRLIQGARASQHLLLRSCLRGTLAARTQCPRPAHTGLRTSFTASEEASWPPVCLNSGPNLQFFCQGVCFWVLLAPGQTALHMFQEALLPTALKLRCNL